MRPVSNITAIERIEPTAHSHAAYDADSCLAWWRGLPNRARTALFDTDFYLQQLDATEPAPEDAILHYVTVGASRRLSPNPLFEPFFYLEQQSEPPRLADPFCHYLREGCRQDLAPHPMLSPRQLGPVGSGPDPGIEALLAIHHADTTKAVPGNAGAERRRGPAAAGSAAWLRRCQEVVLLAPLLRAIKVLVQALPAYAPVAKALETTFDLRYYSSQLRQAKIGADRLGLLLHYATTGHKAGLRPHPLFDPSYYLDASPDVARAGVEPLLHYLDVGWSEPTRKTHCCYVLPSYEQYGRQSPKPVDPITAYVTAAAKARPLLSGGLNAEFYRRRNPKVDWSAADPLLHYLSVGALRGDLPNPAFDPAFYAETAMTEAQRRRLSTLEHFDASPFPRQKTFALFDPAYYRLHHTDLDYIGFDPVTHFVQFGVWEQRRCSAMRSTAYIHATFPTRSFADCPPIGEYLASKANHRRRFLFIGHEASRTGAPRILLRLTEYFASHEGVECISIIDQDGPLIADYAKVSHVVTPTNHRLRFYRGEIPVEALFAELDGIMEQFADNPPVGVFCNCAEVRAYAEYFRQHDIPIVFLMHELAELYPASELVKIARNVDKLVFPAQFVAKGFVKAVPLHPSSHTVLPQGLLRDSFGKAPREPRDVLFKRWDLPLREGAFIVLGCGTIDGRKGFDHFVDVARRIRKAQPDMPIQFLWVGGRKHWRINDGAQWDSTAYWSSWDLRRECLDEALLVLPEVADTEPFFLCADLFLLTSRADPFPCVVHEAMACGLPVVSFSGTGGAPEAFLPDAGAEVAYPDTDAMAACVLSLAQDPARCTRMGAAGRARVEADYQFEPYAERLKQLMVAEDPTIWSGVPGTRTGTDRQRRRVYLTTPTWSLSGVGTFAATLVRYLNEHGFEAEILVTRGRFGPVRPNGRFYEPAPEMLPDAPYRMLQPADLSDGARKSAVRDFLVANAPCILIPNYDYLVSELASELPSTVGVVGIAHSDDIEHYDHCYRLGRFWDRIVAVSDAIAANILALNPSFAAKLVTIRYGIDPAPAGLVAKSLPPRIASASPIRFLYAGRFETEQKRIFDYVRLAQRLAASGIDFRLDLIGDGTKLETVREELASLIQAGVVSVPGRLEREDVLERMQQAHSVLLLSDYEGLPLSLLEGLQSGCIPIVTAMRSGIPEVVEDGVNGFVVPGGDLTAVISRIRLLQDEPTVRARLAEAAAVTPERLRLTTEAMGGSYIALLNAVAADRDAGRGRCQVGLHAL